MKIECTPQELKELIKNTPAAETTDAKLTENQLKQISEHFGKYY